MSDGKMSPEEVAKALRWHANDPAGEEAAVKLRAHIAALEKERGHACACGGARVFHATKHDPKVLHLDTCPDHVIQQIGELLGRCPESRGGGSLVDRLARLVGYHEGTCSATRETLAMVTAERDAALADNVKLLRIAKSRRCDAGPEAAMLGCEDCTALRGPHPGAALLEEHRKALESERGSRLRAERDLAEERARVEAWVANVREVEKALGLDTPHGMTIADARHVLVRARSEGLERAASKTEARAQQVEAARRGLGGDADCCVVELREQADEIRAMKEPE